MRLTRSASASMTSAAASGSSASLTGPGGDRPAKKKPHEYEEVDVSAFGAAIPIHQLLQHIQQSPKAIERNTTAVDQSKGLQNMSV